MRNEKNCCKREVSEIDKAIYALAHMIDSLAERVETIESYIYDEDDIDENAEEDCNDPCFWDDDDDEDWISVSEEQPEELGNYLVTIKDMAKDGDKEHEYRYITVSQYNPKRCEWDEWGVIAWQELPRAYKGK